MFSATVLITVFEQKRGGGHAVAQAITNWRSDYGLKRRSQNQDILTDLRQELERYAPAT